MVVEVVEELVDRSDAIQGAEVEAAIASIRVEVEVEVEATRRNQSQIEVEMNQRVPKVMKVAWRVRIDEVQVEKVMLPDTVPLMVMPRVIMRIPRRSI